jgi:predicted site-specific integrase-resolvase
LLEFERAGLLKPARGPWVDGYKFRLFKAVDIEQFSADLLGCALSVALPVPEYVTLSQAACVLAVSMINILIEVRNGYVRPMDLGTAQPLLQRLVLTHDEIRRYRERRAQQRRDDLGLLTTHEASARLGIDHDVLLRWVRHGFLTCEKMATGGSRFSLVIRQEALEVFQHTYISTEAAAELLGIVPSTVWKYVSKGVLRPVTGRSTSEGGNRLLFLREQVEALAPTDTVTAHDAAALLGLSCSRVYALIRAGKLQPIRLPKGITNPTRLLLSDVNEYQHRMKSACAEDIGCENALFQVDEGIPLLKKAKACSPLNDGGHHASIKRWE